jgi:cell division protein FtsN
MNNWIIAVIIVAIITAVFLIYLLNTLKAAFGSSSAMVIPAQPNGVMKDEEGNTTPVTVVKAPAEESSTPPQLLLS